MIQSSYLPAEWTDDRAPRTGWNTRGYVMVLDRGPSHRPASIHEPADRQHVPTVAVARSILATVAGDPLVSTSDPDRRPTALLYVPWTLDPVTGEVIDRDPYPVRAYEIGPRGGVRRVYV